MGDRECASGHGLSVPSPLAARRCVLTRGPTPSRRSAPGDSARRKTVELLNCDDLTIVASGHKPRQFHTSSLDLTVRRGRLRANIGAGRVAPCAGLSANTNLPSSPIRGVGRSSSPSFAVSAAKCRAGAVLRDSQPAVRLWRLTWPFGNGVIFDKRSAYREEAARRRVVRI